MAMITRLLSSDAALLTAVSATALVALLTLRSSKREKLPPGPPLDPIIGGLRTMPSSYPWVTFADWAKTWGKSFTNCPLVSEDMRLN